MPSKRKKKKKKNSAKKREKRGGEKAKNKSQDCCITFKPKNSKFFAFCEFVDQKAAKCTPINDFF